MNSTINLNKNYYSIPQTSGDASKTAPSGKVVVAPTTSVNTQQLEDLSKELEEFRELGNNRLQELDKLHQTHRETLKEVEKLKMDVCHLK